MRLRERGKRERERGGGGERERGRRRNMSKLNLLFIRKYCSNSGCLSEKLRKPKVTHEFGFYSAVKPVKRRLKIKVKQLVRALSFFMSLFS